MPYRDPLRFLILPAGISIPPPVGESAIHINPGPPPVIEFYTGAASEIDPGRIAGLVSGGNPQLELRGPDTGDSQAIMVLGASSTADEPFVEFQADNFAVLDIDLGTELLDLIGSGSFSPGGPKAQITRFETTHTHMQAQSDFDVANSGALSNTVFGTAPGPSGVGFSFVAPPSGRGIVLVHASINVTLTAAASRTARVAPRLGTGATLGAGTAQNILGVASPHNDFAVDAYRDVSDGTGTGHDQGGISTLISGLTAGDTYNWELQSAVGSATSTTYERLSISITWVPLY